MLCIRQTKHDMMIDVPPRLSAVTIPVIQSLDLIIPTVTNPGKSSHGVGLACGWLEYKIGLHGIKWQSKTNSCNTAQQRQHRRLSVGRGAVHKQLP